MALLFLYSLCPREHIVALLTIAANTATGGSVFYSAGGITAGVWQLSARRYVYGATRAAEMRNMAVAAGGFTALTLFALPLGKSWFMAGINRVPGASRSVVELFIRRRHWRWRALPARS